jgi:hypothetical protein
MTEVHPQTPQELLARLHACALNDRTWLDFELIDEWPTLCEGLADDLKAEDETLRVWVSRVALADADSLPDGAEIGTLEWRRDDTWVEEKVRGYVS